MNREIRVPVQKRSIEKRNNIINTAKKIFNDKGYFNTTTAEIAKEAGLATGSLYAYFKDKKDIFLEVSELYINDIYNNTVENLNKIKDKKELTLLIETIINSVLENHKFSPKFHQEMTMLAYTDDEIKAYYYQQQEIQINKFMEILNEYNLNFPNKKEKMFLAHSLIEEMCHEIIYNEKSNLDKGILIKECTEAVKKIFE